MYMYICTYIYIYIYCISEGLRPLPPAPQLVCLCDVWKINSIILNLSGFLSQGESLLKVDYNVISKLLN